MYGCGAVALVQQIVGGQFPCAVIAAAITESRSATTLTEDPTTAMAATMTGPIRGRINERVCIVTGCSSGIGFEVAAWLGSRGSVNVLPCMVAPSITYRSLS